MVVVYCIVHGCCQTADRSNIVPVGVAAAAAADDDDDDDDFFFSSYSWQCFECLRITSYNLSNNILYITV